MTVNNANIKQYCTFKVAEHLFGMDVIHVQEVLRQQTFTNIPLSGPNIAGLMNLRGQILPAIDLHHRLGFPGSGGARLANVIYASPDGPVDFLADGVGDVIDLASDEIDAVPDSLTGSLRDCVIGVHKLESQLLFIINPESVASLGAEEAK